MKSKKDSGTSFIEEQYFGKNVETQSEDESKDSGNEQEDSFIEDQFFGKSQNTSTEFPFMAGEVTSNQNTMNSTSDGKLSEKKEKETTTDDLETNKDSSFIDGQFFGNTMESPNQLATNEKTSISDAHFSSDYFQKAFKLRQERLAAVEEDDKTEAAEVPEEPSKSVLSTPKFDPLERAQTELKKDEALTELPEKAEEGALSTEQIPALDFAVAFRQHANINLQLSPGDSFYQRYFRAESPFPKKKKIAKDIYDVLEMEAQEEERLRSADAEKFVPIDVSPPWERMTAFEITSFLKKMVIHEDDDILAINKPYGLAFDTLPWKQNISSFLPDLGDALGLREPLQMLHRLDIATTGVLLFAKNKEAAKRVKHQFAHGEILKRYIAVVKGFPRNKSGIINTPIARIYDPVASISRGVLVTSPDMKTIKRGSRELELRDKVAAVTAYKQIFSKHQASLLVCEPSTGVQHQLRLHLADGLGCPILGDHKYSTMTGDKPQKLPRALEKHLGIDRPKARRFMMHLHCLGVSFDRHKPPTIYAKPHTFFLKTLNKLGMVLPNFLRGMRPLM